MQPTTILVIADPAQDLNHLEQLGPISMTEFETEFTEPSFEYAQLSRR